MRLDVDECWRRLVAADHGVLGTVHGERGVDLVPVVLAITDDRRLVVPIDTVKPKSTTRLQRLANLADDPRCTVLVENYDDDWSALWWVRVSGTAEVVDDPPSVIRRFEQYRAPGAVVAAIVITPTAVTGWQATGG
jgi:PPOX class probable F420-dependent enzyme